MIPFTDVVLVESDAENLPSSLGDLGSPSHSHRTEPGLADLASAWIRSYTSPRCEGLPNVDIYQQLMIVNKPSTSIYRQFHSSIHKLLLEFYAPINQP